MESRRRGRTRSRRDDNALSMQVRVALREALCLEIGGWGISQERASARLGMHRTSLNRLLNGEIERFSVDALLNLLAAAGIEVQLMIGCGEIGEPPILPDAAPKPAFFSEPDDPERDRSKLLYTAARVRVEREHVD